MIILDYQGEEIRLERNTIRTEQPETKALAELALTIFDTVGFYPLEFESIASAAIQKYMGAKVIQIVYKTKGWSSTDEPPTGVFF